MPFPAVRGRRKASLFALLAFLSLAGCLREAADPLNVGANDCWPGYQPLFLAENLGYFSDGRIRVNEMPSSSDVLVAFRDRRIEVAALTLDEALSLLQDGIHPQVLAVLDVSNGGDAVVAQPEIETMAELRGKRVAVENSAVGAYMFSRALGMAGLRPADVQVVPLTVDLHARAFQRGQVDAVITFEPVRSQLLSQGACLLFDSSTIPEQIFDVLVASSHAMQEHQELVNALCSAWFAALDHLHRNPADAIERVCRRQKFPKDQFEECLKGLVVVDREESERLLSAPDGPLLLAARQLADVMLDTRLLSRPVDAGLLLDGPRAAQGGAS